MFCRNIKTVACAVSGGVDSAVSCYLLKQKGFEVTGVFMRNWDVTNETGLCSADQDREDAAYVCRHLKVPFVETNFVKNYWNDVFSNLIYSYENGMTPNPDILCNRHIKFGAFFNHVTEKLGFDALATGHYAQNSAGNYLENIHTHLGNVMLMMAKDKWKDQTLFLSQIPQNSLQKTMFPIGAMFKKDVKKIAISIGLEKIGKKRESTGICFVGKRNFQDFIEEYIVPKHGVFIDVETGEIVGEHKGTHYWTLGQRALIKGKAIGYFIAKLNSETQEIFVAPGTNHPALYSQTMFTKWPSWIAGPPLELQNIGSTYQCEFKFQHVYKRTKCTLKICDTNLEEVQVTTCRPTRALTPGQYATFYDGEHCLGSGMITRVGPTVFDLESIDKCVQYDEYEENKMS